MHPNEKTPRREREREREQAESEPQNYLPFLTCSQKLKYESYNSKVVA